MAHYRKIGHEKISLESQFMYFENKKNMLLSSACPDENTTIYLFLNSVQLILSKKKSFEPWLSKF